MKSQGRPKDPYHQSQKDSTEIGCSDPPQPYTPTMATALGPCSWQPTAQPPSGASKGSAQPPTTYLQDVLVFALSVQLSGSGEETWNGMDGERYE